MSYHLFVTSGPDQGRQFTLNEGERALIGRGQDAQIQLSDPHASRKHCEIRGAADGTAFVTDFESAGGTFVNGSRVDEAELNPGDVIRVGTTEIRFQLEPAAVNQTTRVSPPPQSAPKPSLGPKVEGLIGQNIGKYRVEKELGRGKNGIVFLARHVETNTPRALKILSPEIMSTDEDRQRFVRAMKAMHPVKHENVVEIINAGVHDSLTWVAMEYIEGESLTAVIERIGVAGMLDWQNAFRVALHLSRALEALHEQQIVHRNITPPNIIIRAADKVTKLGDSLFAKALQGTTAEQITRPGQLIGDLAYMPPERTRSDSQYDCRSDIYSLGATVYALLTGRPPFEADSLPELVKKIRNDEPAKPTSFQLSINSQFEGAVLKMLAKRPEDRYQTPAELRKNLEAIGRFQNIDV